MNVSPHAAIEAVAAFTPHRLPLGVAFSGGADSTALLAICAQKWPAQVVALHVNHGLQAAAADFEQHCRSVCNHLGVPLRIARVNATASPGESPEDAARIARYRALADLSQDTHGQPLHAIATAQHADDQVETLLIALGRGAGLAGLSAMPAQWQRHGLHFHRPFLKVSAQDIRAWLAQHRIPFIEDPSNTDEAFTRNRIRAQVLPALQVALPQFRQTFGRSAAHAAQAQSLLNEYAALDMERIGRNTDGLPLIQALQTLSPERMGNVLRYWLKTHYQVIPSSRQLDELRHQVLACRTRGHRIHIKVGAGYVQRQAEVLAWYNP